MKNNYLTCKRVTFYSMLDESIFFEWIKKIDCIEKYEGAGDELYLDLYPKKINYENMKNLIALFYRYNIDMKQLAQLVNDKNIEAVNPWKEKIF
jgi:hypothetical protein